MLERFKESSSFQSAANRYDSLSHREQLSVMVLAAFFALIFVIYFIVIPASNYHTKAQTDYTHALDTYRWMQDNRALVDHLGENVNSREAGQSLLGIANQTSKGFQLSFKRYQPVGSNGLSLWLDNVSFNNTVLWLERLDKRYNIHVKEIAVERQNENGVVNVRLVLQG